jgi:hypothetical protein
MATVTAPAPAPAMIAAAPAATPASGDDFERWRRAVERVKERKLLLGTCLEEGAFLGILGRPEGGVGIAVRVALTPEHSFHKAMLEMKENREILNQEFERCFGPGASLACVVGNPFGASAAVARVTEELQALEGEEPQSPKTPDTLATVPDRPPAGPTIAQRIVEIFDGEILDLNDGRGAPGSGIA